jgi:putative thioredoxin
VIEQLALENKSSWELVKVNTEEHQEIAMQYSIRSIPNVKLFVNGTVVNEFAGALPRLQIVQWLDENIPTEEKGAWAEVSAKVEHVSEKEALVLLETFVDRHPMHPEAKLAMAKRMAFTNPEKAQELVAAIKMGESGYDIAEDINNLKELLEIDAQANGETSELFSAAESIRAGDFAAGIERIIEVVSTNKDIQNELPRRAAIAVFRLLGSQHPVSRTYRRLFDMALY